MGQKPKGLCSDCDKGSTELTLGLCGSCYDRRRRNNVALPSSKRDKKAAKLAQIASRVVCPDCLGVKPTYLKRCDTCRDAARERLPC